MIFPRSIMMTFAAANPLATRNSVKAIAILAGDALLTLAFETIGATPTAADRRAAILTEVAAAAAPSTEWSAARSPTSKPREARRSPNARIHPPLENRRADPCLYHRRGLVRGRRPRRCLPPAPVRDTIGWAFQVTDDILDVEESSAALGKTAGKDLAQQKATYPAVYGLERSHQIANDLATKAIDELALYADRAARIREIAEFLVHRRA